MIINDIYENLREIPLDKQIAIWGLEKSSFDIFTCTINNRVKVSYFIDDKEIYNGPEFFDIKIILKEKLFEIKESIHVLIGAKEYQGNREFIHTYFEKNFTAIDVEAIRREISNSERVFIYGAGHAGKRTLEVLKSQRIEIEGFIDSNKDKIGKTWCDYSIYDKNILNNATDVVVIAAVSYGEIYESLRKQFDENKIFIDYRNCDVINRANYYKDKCGFAIKYKNLPIQFMEDARVCYSVLWTDFREKRIVLYGKNEIADQVVEIFDMLNLKIDFIVDDDSDEYNIYNLAYEFTDNMIVLITKINEGETYQNKKINLVSGEILETVGLKRFRDYRSVFQISNASRGYVQDPLLYGICVYSKTPKDRLGFYFYNENKNKKIVILGGSTSNPPVCENLVKSWPEYFSHKYSDACIIVAAMSGFGSTRTLLKLIRDINDIKPDLVICYSGGNEFFKEREIYSNTQSAYKIKKNDLHEDEYWILMQRYMKAICDVNESEYISILHPALITRNSADITSEEKVYNLFWNGAYILNDEYPYFVKSIRKKIELYDWMYDLVNVFDGVKETVYRDCAHLTSRGNEIIAESIHNIVKDYYRKKEKEL